MFITIPPIQQVRLLDQYQRDAWQMHWADQQMGPGVDIGDPTERNYWMILPAERVAIHWQYVEADAHCRTCRRHYAEHGWGDGLDRCGDEPAWGAESAGYQSGR